MSDWMNRKSVTGPLPASSQPTPWSQRGRAAVAYGAATIAVALVTGLIWLIPGASHIANISLLYLLAVIGCAMAFGSGPAVVASIMAFLAFDYCFVQPLATFTVADPAEWLALVIFLVTAIVTGHLTAQLQASAYEARRREQEAIALAENSWTIASQVSTQRALAEVLRRLVELVGSQDAAIIVRDDHANLRQVARVVDQAQKGFDIENQATRQAITFVLEHGQPIAWEADRHLWDKALADSSDTNAVYVPLIVEHRTLGVLVLHVRPDQLVSTNVRRLVESLANHAAVILERERLARTETMAKALSEADRLKTALLSMVSHDFRSPLASIKASAASLLSAGAAIDVATREDLLNGVVAETDRLDRMVGNILALSRLDADAWRPQSESTPIAELVEAALASFSKAQNQRISVTVPDHNTEAWLDPVQIARVIHNLVENALKYSAADQPVEVRVSADLDLLNIDVLDRGPGFVPGDETRVFERFYRAAHLPESAIPGLGIGLAICQGLVEAHGGHLSAHNREGGGASMHVVLPLAAPVQTQQQEVAQ